MTEVYWRKKNSIFANEDIKQLKPKVEKLH